jgi:hypothetical protein
MTNVFLGRIALNVMMCRFGCAPLGRNAHFYGATHATISLVVGVQEGGCDGASRNSRVTAQRTHDGWIDESEGEEVGKKPTEWPGCSQR